MPEWVRSMERLGACDTDSSGGLDANDGTLRLASRDLVETCGVIHRLRSEPHEIVAGPGWLVHGVRFEQLHSALLRIGDGSVEERSCDTLVAILRRNDEADD